jgi:SAM-dependent methyltransferase
VLDVGCAAGGFSRIWRHFRPDMRYTGVDVSAGLLDAARDAHPDDRFLVGHCADGLPFADGSIAIVQALGWLHWEPRYEAALRELWRVAARYCFVDVRLREPGRPAMQGHQKVAYSKAWDGATVTPYIAVDWSQLAGLFATLSPAAIYGHGYWGTPADTVVGIDSRVCFSTFVLEKDSSDRPRECVVCIDSPLEWPPDSGLHVKVLPGTALKGLCADPHE